MIPKLCQFLLTCWWLVGGENWWFRRGLQPSPSILCIWSQWGFSRRDNGAEVSYLPDSSFFHYGTGIEDTQMAHSRNRPTEWVHIEESEKRVKLSKTYLFCSPSWNSYHIIFSVIWEPMDLKSLCRLKATQLKNSKHCMWLFYLSFQKFSFSYLSSPVSFFSYSSPGIGQF